MLALARVVCCSAVLIVYYGVAGMPWCRIAGLVSYNIFYFNMLRWAVGVGSDCWGLKNEARLEAKLVAAAAGSFLGVMF